MRNTTSQIARIRGRIPYTRPDGEAGFINIPNAPLPANTARVVNLQGRIASAHLPASVTFAGIELEYDAPKGTVLAQVQSVSPDGNHVFEVPMMDPEKMPASAGGFPWKADGDFRTIVYIKNETDAARKYTVHLLYEGGQYSLGVNDIKPNQTAAVDFRELRDSQTPDSMGRVIPLSLSTGQIAWSVKGGENKVLSGRSEQISPSGGVASTYACYNCCPDSVYQTGILPASFELLFGATDYLAGQQTDMSCNQTLLGPYVPTGILWHTDNPNVVTVDGGQLYAAGTGSATISATWDTCLYWLEGGYCTEICDQTTQYAPVGVDPWVVINGPDSAAGRATVLFTAVVHGSPGIEFLWTSEAPSGAGNNPHVNFTSPNGDMTNANAHWFALPNQECPGTSLSSTYKIKVTAWTAFGESTAEKDFTVNIPAKPGTTSEPKLEGHITVTEYPAGHFTVTGHTLTRVTQPATIFLLATSQFYDKTLAHENVHVPQYHTGNLLGNYFTVNGFWTYLQSLNLSSSTQAGLMTQVGAARDNYYESQGAAIIASGDLAAAEIAAYNVSDPITPMFAYQRCGRTVFP
ncbi:MAG TPA: hypothetical protein PKD26_07680 [Pyrinomonadaceae bacterium]|nr:hypothetical protein [Pyrinomonadaceae bacterium]